MEERIKIRTIVQSVFFILAVGLTINQAQVALGGGISWLSAGYIHYVCPICGVTTIYQFFASSTDFLTKIMNPVGMVISGSLIVAVFIGPVFCGWLCPFGSYQEFIGNMIGKKLFKKKFNHFINPKLDGALRWLRYGSLLLVIYMTAKSTMTLIQSLNPYHALLNLFVGEFALIGLSVLVIITLASIFIHRPWCKYLCPYGAFLGIFNVFRLKAIVREPSTCVSCHQCDNACPMNIQVSSQRVVRDHQCNSCMECTSAMACPKEATVRMKGTKGIEEKVALSPVNIGAYVLGLVSLVTITLSIGINSSEATTSALTVYSQSALQLSGTYASGTYTGQAVGFNNGLTVEVTIEDNRIVAIDIVDHNETIGYYESAFETVPYQIMESQSTQVDTVSGATRSSEGIIDAVEEAISQAQLSTSSETSDSQTQVDLESQEQVDQKVNETQSDLDQETSQNQEDDQEAEFVVVEEGPDHAYPFEDGTYIGAATGFVGDVIVEVTVEGSELQAIDFISENETPKYFDLAIQVIDDLLSQQTTDVDTVSGATISSNAIIEATKDALTGSE